MRFKRLFGVNDNLFFSTHDNSFSFIAPIFLGITVGIQWLTAALLISGLHPRPRPLDELTDSGKYWFRPEYDIMVYLAGCVVALVLVFIFLFIFKKWSHSRKFAQARQVDMVILGLISFIVHAVLVVFFDLLVLDYWQQSVPYTQKIVVTSVMAILFVLPGISVLLFALAHIWQPKRLMVKLADFHNRNRQMINRGFDILVLLCIVLLVYVPDWTHLAGKIFLNDQFLHWDGFAVRQALGFRHGLMLGRDIFIQYGIGWPLLFSFLSRNAPLTYSFMAGIGVLYACIYYIGVYLLLRLLSRSLLWSAGGIGIILLVHLFTRNLTAPFFWETPSSTLLRSPFDIWFFIALFFVLNSKKKVWHYLLGGITGLAFLFGFDTGMYLVIVMLIYYAFNLFSLKKKTLQLNKSNLPQLSAATTTFFVIALSGLLFAGKSAFFTASFWSGLFEGISEYGSGISNLPMALLRQKTGLLFFEVIVFAYLGFVANLFLGWLRGKITIVHQFSALLSLYGLATLLIFLGRSHVLNLLHPTIAFWILLIWFSAKLHSVVISRRFVSYPILIPAGFCVISILFLLSSSLVRNYPHVLNYFSTRAPGGICLWSGVSDICGVSQTNEVELDKFQTIISWLEEVTSDGYEVALFDDKDTFFYVAIGQAPWFRYRPGEIFTYKQLASIHAQIKDRRPEYIVMEEETANQNDVWKQTRLLLTQDYLLKDTVAGYGIWKLK